MTLRLLAAGSALVLALAACSQNYAAPPTPGVGTSAQGMRLSNLWPQERMNFFQVPEQASWPEAIVSGPQGKLWFTDEYAATIASVGTDGAITEFPINGQEVEGITTGADGNLWFTQPGANVVGKMTPAGKTTLFQINGSDPSPRGITQGPDGNMWTVELYDGYLDRITESGKITRFQIAGSYSSPWDITTGPDGDLWFTNSFLNTIGRFNPKTLQFDKSIIVPTQEATPWGILLAPDHHIWFTERTGNNIAEVVNDHKVLEFPIRDPKSYPEMLAPGSDGMLWFVNSQVGNIGRIDPKTGKFAPVIQLSSSSIPQSLAEGPDGNIWFTVAAYNEPGQIGKVIIKK